MFLKRCLEDSNALEFRVVRGSRFMALGRRVRGKLAAKGP